MIFMHKVVDVHQSGIRVSAAATGYQQKTGESNWLEMKSIKGLKKAPSGSQSGTYRFSCWASNFEKSHPLPKS